MCWPSPMDYLQSNVEALNENGIRKRKCQDDDDNNNSNIPKKLSKRRDAMHLNEHTTLKYNCPYKDCCYPYSSTCLQDCCGTINTLSNIENYQQNVRKETHCKDCEQSALFSIEYKAFRKTPPPPLIYVPLKESNSMYSDEKENITSYENNSIKSQYSATNLVRRLSLPTITMKKENKEEDDEDKRSSSCPPNKYNSVNKDQNKTQLKYLNSAVGDNCISTSNKKDTEISYQAVDNIFANGEKLSETSHTESCVLNDDSDIGSNDDDDESLKKKTKQEKNKSASKKYRDRKKQKQSEIFQKELDLSTRNQKLRSQIKDIEHDIAAFETDLAKKINTKEKIKQQVCTVLLRGYDTGYCREDEIERNIMKRILEKITNDNGHLVKEAFFEIVAGLKK